MSKLSRKTEFSQRERQRIKERDGGCIFCKAGYHNDECKNIFERQSFQIMHYIPRSKMGLGIAQNAAVGCIFHHMMFDNGNKGRRAEMRIIFKEYLMNHYTNWNEEDLVYKKYDF